MAYRPDVETTLARYAEAWHTDDPDERWSLVHACTANDVTWTGPGEARPVESQAALAAFLGMPREGRFEVGRPDAHHDWVRARWRRVTPDGQTTGLLVARLDGDNRLAEVVHFED